ncbi:MAG: hypothetical protein M3461_05750 [Pseudomonadota bacterium]|nr:hypothetical protein [Pseudomonadota bacterium]
MSSTVHSIVAGLALPALAVLCPEALAHDRVGAMESKLRQMQQEMNALQRELDRMRAGEAQQEQSIQGMETQNATQHQEITDRVTKVEEAPGKRTMKNFVFFRGGYTEYRDLARGFESFTDTHNTLGLGGGNVADDGYYVGAAIEHSLTSDLWGLWKGTEALGEISLEYKHFKSEPATLVVPTAECALLSVNVGLAVADCVVTGDVAKTMFTVSAAPKIKFMEGSKLRPWIIPGGLDFHVISPPSDGATYLDVGIQFGAGVEYEILPGIKAGLDGRYHLIPDESSNTENNIVEVFAANGLALTGDTDKDLDFWTLGGYVGFSF